MDRPQSYRLRLVLPRRLRSMGIPKGTSRYVGATMVLQQLQQRQILIEPIHGQGLQFGMPIPKPLDFPRIGSKDMAASRRSPEACLVFVACSLTGFASCPSCQVRILLPKPARRGLQQNRPQSLLHQVWQAPGDRSRRDGLEAHTWQCPRA